MSASSLYDIYFDPTNISDGFVTSISHINLSMVARNLKCKASVHAGPFGIDVDAHENDVVISCFRTKHVYHLLQNDLHFSSLLFF
jgi:hypothetical protein